MGMTSLQNLHAKMLKNILFYHLPQTCNLVGIFSMQIAIKVIFLGVNPNTWMAVTLFYPITSHTF
jgi:hypothetical protein